MSVTSFVTTLAGCTPSSAATGNVSLDGTVGAASGGTGTSTAPTAGQILVGTSAGGYTPYTLASGSGISTTTGDGTLQINNTGVLTPTFSDATFAVQNNADNTKQLLVDNSTATTGTSTTLQTSQTSNVVVTFPDATGTLPTLDSVGTFTNKTIYTTFANVTCTGTNQATGAPITAQYNRCTVPSFSSRAVVLPTPAGPGEMITLHNVGTSNVVVFPAVGGQIGSLGVNQSMFLFNVSGPGSGGLVTFISESTTQWKILYNEYFNGFNGLTPTRAADGGITISVNDFTPGGTIQDATGMMFSAVNGILAAGTDQTTATQLHASFNQIDITPLGTGVKLNANPLSGLIVVVKNNGVNPLLVYPSLPTFGHSLQIDGGGINNPVTLNVGATAVFQVGSFPSSTLGNWWTIAKNDPTVGVNTISGGTTGLMPSTPSIGNVVLSGTLTPANGGTGATATPANGQLLIGNGTNYTVSALSAGTGISTTVGSGTLQVTNTGVTSVAGTAGQINASASTGAVTLSLAAKATLQSSSQNPTGTTSTAGVMMGLGATITPSASGNLLVNVTGSLVNNHSTTSDTVQIRYGTGSAPANGAALTGTAIGSAVVFTNGSSTSNKAPFNLSAVITGLTVSTAIWIDISLATSSSSGTATASVVTVCAVEV